MARRKLQEINAGSMADIAFLLLIFFLVATTMEVDSGIARNLPLKLEGEHPPVPERNVLRIELNLQDDIMVEGELLDLVGLHEKILNFYGDNKNGMDNNNTMPLYELVTTQKCLSNISHYQEALQHDRENHFLQQELSKWQTKLELCEALGGTFPEISKSSIIRFQYHSQTSYGMYMDVQNTIKQVVNQLRIEKCKELGWPNYFELNEQHPDDQKKIKMLRIMIPERIIEVKA